VHPWHRQGRQRTDHSRGAHRPRQKLNRQLLIPWRFFRLWALLDGVDAPENMVRCVANNYSTLGFWRSWHRSYNLWVVRYVSHPTILPRAAAMRTIKMCAQIVSS
jgi:D-alanyl-lipoteichoic acid acyltransferase DltB (MBOAT superfamily)